MDSTKKMKNALFRAAAPALVLLITSVTHASPHYRGNVSGTLLFWNVGVESQFDTVGSSTSVPGFYITVDPLFVDPRLQVVRDTSTNGFGSYSAEAFADAGITAEDPLNMTVGDAISIWARSRGVADRPGPSFASSSASAETAFYFVNQSEVDVAVDMLWQTSFTNYFFSSGPDGEHATSSIDLTPTGVDLGTIPIVARIPAGQTQAFPLAASAAGSASTPGVVPEPSAWMVWGLLFAVVGIGRAVSRMRTCSVRRQN